MVDAIRRQDRIKMIHVRHEETGAFAASAQAKLSGKLAVCMGTSGPGAVHLLNGLYDAKLDAAPVLALTGQVETKFQGSDYHQEINVQGLFEDVSVFNHEVLSAGQLPLLIQEAIRASYHFPGVSHISMPMDVVGHKVHHHEFRNKPPFAKPDIIPNKVDLEAAANCLNNAEKVIILAGIGARHAAKELLQAAEILKAPITKALRGKDILPDDNPYCIGGHGLLGTLPSHHAMNDCDCILMVGTDFPHVEFLPQGKTAVQIDINGYQIGKRIPVEAALVGDAASTLRSLIPLLKNKTDDAFLMTARKNMESWRAKEEEMENSADNPIHPQALAAAISKYAADDAIYCIDTGNVTVWAARNIRIRGSQRLTLSGGLASMAFGMPAAIGAKLLYPNNQVIAFCGDGGFAMLMGDFLTAVKYDLAIIVVVFNNYKLGMIQAEEEVMGIPEYEVLQNNCDFAEYAKICGGDGIKVKEITRLDEAIRQAVASNKPFILDVDVNPNELPYPAEITAKQAIGFVTAKVKEFFGDGEKEKV